MAEYKTPGVYIEETPHFPASIEAVETALPAFIGYTEKAFSQDASSLALVARRIHSLSDYERLFGGPPPQAVTLWLDAQSNIEDARVNQAFYMYDSLRLFFSNGGDACMIVSVGDYNSEITQEALAQGLAAIGKAAEPTIIVMPEAVTLADHGVSLYKDALTQCAGMYNRMTLCELPPHTVMQGFEDEVDYFRDHIGTEHLRYGAAYGPWLIASFPREPGLGKLTLKCRLGDAAGQTTNETVLLPESLTADATIKSKISDIYLIERACNLLNDSEAGLLKNAVVLEQAVAILIGNASDTASDYQAGLQAQSRWFFALLDSLLTVAVDCPDSQRVKVASTITGQAQARMANALRLLVAHHHALLAHTGITLIDEAASCLLLGLKDQTAILALGILPDVEAQYTAAPADIARVRLALAALESVTGTAIDWFRQIKLSTTATQRALNQDLYASFTLFRTWTDRSTRLLNTLPPSGAIAGICAKVDASRGVWKAPASVTVADVMEPALHFNDGQTDQYNVHESGKSINLIREFPGKGTWVWGARTLAGNDNEWRYVSTRRLFGMVEASIANGLQSFVFEPNDANTWVKVTALISNFLTSLWRQGALQGSKPEHAFFVNAGLGKTMTALDVSEKRLIVEIGLAAVRPAEFIIVRIQLNLQ
jgi:hypothetical protein